MVWALIRHEMAVIRHEMAVIRHELVVRCYVTPLPPASSPSFAAPLCPCKIQLQWSWQEYFQVLVLWTFTGFKIVNRFVLLSSMCVFLQLSVDRNLGGVLTLFLNFIVVHRAESLTDLADQDGAKGYWNPS